MISLSLSSLVNVEKKSDRKKTMEQMQILVSASWEDYEKLLELRGDGRTPSMAFDSGKLEIQGFPEDWSDSLRLFIQELIEDEEDLIDALAAEENAENNQRIPWEEVKRQLNI